MAAPIAPAAVERMSAEEFYARFAHDGLAKRYELVDGEVLRLSPTNLWHSVVCSNIDRHLGRYVDEHDLGVCATEQAGFRLDVPRRAGDTVRAPDVSFISTARLAEIAPGRRGFTRGGPDLAVEVRSPDDTDAEVLRRRDDLFADGTRLFWDVDLWRRTVAVHAPGARTRLLGADDTLDGADVVPGFTMRVADAFRRVPVFDA